MAGIKLPFLFHQGPWQEPSVVGLHTFVLNSVSVWGDILPPALSAVVTSLQGSAGLSGRCDLRIYLHYSFYFEVLSLLSALCSYPLSHRLLCHMCQALPLPFDSDLTQQISPPAASRQYNLVMPSLAPDKTSARGATSNSQTPMHIILTLFLRRNKLDSDIPLFVKSGIFATVSSQSV